MVFEQMLVSVKRGHVATRREWDDKTVNVIFKRNAVKLRIGKEELNYRPRPEDMVAEDWELIL